MRGQSTDGAGEAQSFHIVFSTAEDGRHLATVPGTTISIVGSDQQMVMEEVHRQLNTYLHVGGPESK